MSSRTKVDYKATKILTEEYILNFTHKKYLAH